MPRQAKEVVAAGGRVENAVRTVLIPWLPAVYASVDVVKGAVMGVVETGKGLGKGALNLAGGTLGALETGVRWSTGLVAGLASDSLGERIQAGRFFGKNVEAVRSGWAGSEGGMLSATASIPVVGDVVATGWTVGGDVLGGVRDGLGEALISVPTALESFVRESVGPPVGIVAPKWGTQIRHNRRFAPAVQS